MASILLTFSISLPLILEIPISMITIAALILVTLGYFGIIRTIENSGVEIATKPGSNARAIFGGEVFRIQLVKGSNLKIVYVQHGDFITVYMNLLSVNVNTGDKVSVKEILGKINTSLSPATT